MGQALAGMSIVGASDLGADFHIDEDEGRVWAEVTIESGDVYELSARWVGERSP